MSANTTATTTANTPLYSALILGTGPAGLSAALSLSRLRQRSAVFSSPRDAPYRNARASHMHTVPGFDHRPPGELRAAIRRDLERYSSGGESATLTETAVVTATKKTDTADGTSFFEVVDSAGATWRGRKLLLATGVRDDLDALPGLGDVWGRGVYHCPFCEGWEFRDRPLGALLTNPMAAHAAGFISLLSPADFTLYTGNLPDQAAVADSVAGLRAVGCKIDARKVVALSKPPPAGETRGGEEGEQEQEEEEGEEGVVLHFEDGATHRLRGLYFSPPMSLNGDVHAQLGCAVADTMPGAWWLKTEGMFSVQTSVKGVFVAGDAGAMAGSVMNAVSSGTAAGAMMAMELAKDRIDTAVEEGKTKVEEAKI